MSIGPAEIIIVLILALLVFGPKKLPQMGRSLGKGVREFRKAAETAKTELGLGEVTDQINEVKASITEPIKEVTGSFSDLKSSVDLKSAIEAPVGAKAAATAGAAVAAGVADAGTDAGGAGDSTQSPPDTAAAQGAYDEGPETPAITPDTAFADVPQAPAPEEPTVAADAPPDAPEAPVAPETPEGVTADMAAPSASGG
jgi:TatA/E family protein of Tat protein translocase